GNVTMKGYLKNPPATEAAFAGGWFHSGDLAVMQPDGYAKIKDRAKDIIISGGENISSIEVEDILYRHPAVLAAAVVATPDEKWGEAPCAFIELKDGANASAEEIIEHCRAHLARFKAPREVVFGTLPKTSTGKIQKFLLRGPEMVLAIKALADDARIRAVVVEVDSLGGSAPVSDAIHRSLRKLSRRKPTVAFVMTSGLSGGYLIACAASKIVALPTSLVGSIGVIFMRPVVQELMEKIGVRMVMTHEGHLKGMVQPWREPTEEELKKTEALTDQYYNWFIDAVARARNLDQDTGRGYA